MPGRDGTGPQGQGPLTGRGAGYCAGNGAPEYGFGLGLGLGRRCRRGGGAYGRRKDIAANNRSLLDSAINFLTARLEGLKKQRDALQDK